MSDGENSADPRYRGCAPCVASNQLRRVSSRFVSARVRCLRSAGRMRVCQIQICRFRQGSGMLYLRNQIWDLQTGLAYRNGYGCFAYRDSAKSKRGNLRQGYFVDRFCRERCSERWCHFHKTNHLYTLDSVITCVEIKISVSDFHSAHGHNFVGHCNYYAMPTEVYKKVKGEIPEDIGVLLYYDGESTCGIRKAKECKPQILSESTRKMADSVRC